MDVRKFTSFVKEEIVKTNHVRACCQQTAFRTVVCFSRSQGSSLEFSTPSLGRFILYLMKRLKIESWGMGISASRMKGQIIFSALPLFLLQSPFKDDLKRCCQRALLRTLFLLRGLVSLQRKGYHLEIRTSSRSQAMTVCRICRLWGMAGGVYFRDGEPVFYSKNGESIRSFFAWLGASRSLLKFEELRALREIKNDVRRRVNYEAANLGRTVKAASRHKEKIQQLMMRNRWKKLPSALKAAALGRLQYPELSLEELARKLDVTKSALNHRFRRLEKLA